MTDDKIVRLLTVLNAISSRAPIDDSELIATERPPKLNRKRVVLVGERSETPTPTRTPGTEGTPSQEVDSAFVVESVEEGKTAEGKNTPFIYSARRLTAEVQLVVIFMTYTSDLTRNC
jgi:hypothetical protein